MSRCSQRRGLGKLIGITGVAAVVLAVGACSSSGSSSNSSSTGATSNMGSTSSATASASSTSTSAMSAEVAKYSTAATSFEAVSPVSGVSALKGKTVWYIPIGEATPLTSAIGTTLTDALGQAGIKVHLCDGQFLPTDIATCMAQAITGGAAGVVTSYVDYAALPTAFNSLVSHHIPVFVGGEPADGGKTSSAQLGFDDPAATMDLEQKLLIESVIAHSDGKANILYVGNSDSASTEDAAAYAKSVAAQECSTCSFTEIVYNTADLSKLPSQVSAALIAHPSTTYVVTELDPANASAVEGVQSAGYTSKVTLASAGGDLDVVQRVRAGHVLDDVALSPAYTGWQYADGIIRMLTGHNPAPAEKVSLVRVLSTANTASLALTPTAYADNGWFGSTSYEQAYLKAWGVS
jgi:ABC-type sugar transport system substrate-binding protein